MHLNVTNHVPANHKEDGFGGVSVLCYININLLPEQLELARPF